MTETNGPHTTHPVEPVFPATRNPVWLADGRIDCDLEHPDHGWIPTTLDRDDNTALFDHVVSTGNVAAFTPPSHEQQRMLALSRVRDIHAGLLRGAAGDATVEERGTWKPKEDAARALLAATASKGQKAMLAAEAGGDGTDPVVLARRIVARADRFLALIGQAAGLKAEAKKAIIEATAETVPLDDVAPRLAAILTRLSGQAGRAGGSSPL